MWKCKIEATCSMPSSVPDDTLGLDMNFPSIPLLQKVRMRQGRSELHSGGDAAPAAAGAPPATTFSSNGDTLPTMIIDACPCNSIMPDDTLRLDINLPPIPLLQRVRRRWGGRALHSGGDTSPAADGAPPATALSSDGDTLPPTTILVPSRDATPAATGAPP